MPNTALAQAESPLSLGEVVDATACNNMRQDIAGHQDRARALIALRGYADGSATTTICPCSPKPGVWLERFVYCFADAPNGIIYRATQRVMQGAMPFFRTIIGAAILASMVIFGYKLATGSLYSIKKEGFLLILKIAGVAMFLEYFSEIHKILINTTYGLGNISASLLQELGGVCNFPPGSVPANTVPSLWAQFDCIFDKLMGLNGNLLAAGILGFAVLLLLGLNGLGVLIFFSIVSLIVTLTLSAMRAVYTYISVIMSLSLILLMAPIFVPLILFPGNYSHRFTRYFTILLGHTLVPLILFLMMTVSLILLKYSLFVGPTSLMGAITYDSPTQVASYGQNIGQKTGSDASAYKKEEKVEIINIHTEPGVITSDPNDPNHVRENQYGFYSTPNAINDPNKTTEGWVVTYLDEDQMAQDVGAPDAGTWQTGILLQLLASLIVAFISFSMFKGASQISSELVSHAFNAKHVTQNQMPGQALIQRVMGVVKLVTKLYSGGASSALQGGAEEMASGALRTAYNSLGSSFKKMAGSRK